jgi:type I restriction enzyme S subunit
MNNSDTFFDSLPEDWDIAKIGTAFDIKQGKSLSSRNQTGAYLKPFLRTSNVFWGRLDLAHLDEMDFSDDECKALTLEYDDLLVCEGGDIGRTAIWRNEKSDCYYQNHLHRLRVKDKMIEPLFIMYWMHIALTQLGVYEGLANKTTIPNLSGSRLREFTIPVPEKKEQQKIAAILFKMQQASEIQEAIIEKTRELKKSTLHHVFTHGVLEEEVKETEVGPIPKSWEVARLGELTSVITKGSSPRWQGFEYCREGVPFIRSQNVGDGKLLLDEIAYLPTSFNEKEKRSIIHTSDLLINLVGASIGRVAIANEKINGANMNQAVAIVRFRDNSLLSWFIMYYLLTTRGQEEINFNKKEIARANISLSDINGFVIPKPSEKEQRQIVQIFNIIDKKIEMHTAKKSALQDLFKTMLNKLMTGEIRVKDLDIDVSEVES